MFQVVLVISLLMAHYTAQTPREVLSNCNEDVLLSCSSVNSDLIDFLAIAWYKVNQEIEGIIRKQKYGDTQRYNYSREARFGDNHGLLLSRVTPADSATYKCAISANVGGKNQEFRVRLTVHECVTSAEPTTMAEQNKTRSSPPPQVQNVPISWSLTAYALLAVTKILLSLSSIWVIHIISSRRRKNYWRR